MQDAFAIEKNAIGNWVEIGYSAPGKQTTSNPSSFSSDNFTYTGANVNSATSGQGSAAVANAWQAVANYKLNDCAKGGNWSISSQYTGTSTTNASVTFVTSGAVNCTALTPAFAKLVSGR